MKRGFTRLDAAACAAFAAFATSSVVTPICLPEISRTLSTSLAEGGGLETARTSVVLVVLVLAGLLARRWGKKHFITLGQYLLSGGLLVVSFAQSYLALAGALMLVGIGAGFLEALVNPLVADLHPDDSSRYLNITNAFYPVGVMTAAVVFGELLTLGLSWRMIFRIAAAVCLSVALFWTFSRGPAVSPATGRARHSAMRILRSASFWVFAVGIFLGAGVESAFTFWSRSYVSTYLRDVPRAGAIAVVLFAGMMAIGRILAGKLSERMSLQRIMVISASLGVTVSAVLPLVTHLLGFYLLLALAGVAAACFWPTILAAASERLPGDTTVLFVMLSCMGIAGFGLTPWFMGLLGDTFSLRASFALVPFLFVGLIAILGIDWYVGGQAQRKNVKRET